MIYREGGGAAEAANDVEGRASLQVEKRIEHQQHQQDLSIEYADAEPHRLLLRIQFVENNVDGQGGRREDRGCEVVAEPDTTARAICR